MNSSDSTTLSESDATSIPSSNSTSSNSSSSETSRPVLAISSPVKMSSSTPVTRRVVSHFRSSSDRSKSRPSMPSFGSSPVLSIPSRTLSLPRSSSRPAIPSMKRLDDLDKTSVSDTDEEEYYTDDGDLSNSERYSSSPSKHSLDSSNGEVIDMKLSNSGKKKLKKPLEGFMRLKSPKKSTSLDIGTDKKKSDKGEKLQPRQLVVSHGDSPEQTGRRRNKSLSRIHTQTDTAILAKPVKIDKFVIYLPENQMQSFFYSPDQVLNVLIDKVMKTREGLSLDTHIIHDCYGNTVALTSTIKEIPDKHVFFLSKNCSDQHSLVKCADGRIISRRIVIKERAPRDIDKLITFSSEEVRLVSNSFSKFVSQRKKAKLPAKQINIETPLYSHAHKYSSSVLKVQTEPYPVIIAGNLDTLIEVLTHNIGRDREFELSFVMCYDAFVNARLLFDKLKQRWDNNPDTQVRQSIMEFFKLWFNKRIDVLNDDSTLKDDLIEWINLCAKDMSQLDQMRVESFKLFLNAQIDSTRSAYRQGVELMLRQEDMEGAPSPIILNELSGSEYSTEIVDLFDFHPTEIARQMTLLDAQYLSNIKPHEWLHQGWMKGKSPNISKFIDRFNQVLERNIENLSSSVLELQFE
eukprot:TRINITY_DN3461_c0_g1_i3.p1 TRINITY_DN3461_c0_g1~~TRINITY_DN3461_c0_g1_i3.p1  ORF type:complete len:632 (-),score=133.75 TRINITY_DN3461_c0_g1_i3:377-2272(-)